MAVARASRPFREGGGPINYRLMIDGKTSLYSPLGIFDPERWLLVYCVTSSEEWIEK